MDYLFYLLLPFVELGASYYASFGTVLAVCTVVAFARPLRAGLGRCWPLAIMPIFMIPSLLTGHNGDVGQDVLRVGREALILVLMVGLVNGALVRPAAINANRVANLNLLMLAALFLLTLFQYISLAKGRYFGFPGAWYSQGDNTIATELSIRYTHVRPSAVYSEPSYLSFVVLSVVFMMSPALDMRRRLAAMIVLALVIGALSQAASFALFAALIGLVYIYDRLRVQQRLFFAPTVILTLIGLLLFGSDIGPIARVLEGGNVHGDSSIFVRIFGPAQIIPSYLIEHPAGTPFSALLDILGPYTNPLGFPPEEFLHNAMFDLLFEYGFLGIFPLIGIFYVRDNTMRAYLVSCMLFNGAFLSLDKLAIVGFAASVYGAMKRRSEMRAALRERTAAMRRYAQGMGIAPGVPVRGAA